MRKLLPLASFVLVLSFTNSFAQSDFTQKSAYSILSSNPNEIIISISPNYHIHTVVDEKTGEKYERINFSGSSIKGIPIGAPAAEWLPLSVLIPSNESAYVEIINVEYGAPDNAVLAPVPNSIFIKDAEFKTRVESYSRNPELYSIAPAATVTTTSPGIFRTSYTQEIDIHPISFDAASNTIRLIRQMIVKISFAGSGQSSVPQIISPNEAEIFGGMFVNGATREFYNSAIREVTKAIPASSTVSYKQTASPNSNAQWLEVTTSDQGVYHITASDLAKSGITSADPASIQLFGYGGATVPEDIDSAIGELHECTVDVLRNGDGSFSEARFYDPGLNEWYYNPGNGHTTLFWLYHILNPFTTSGHYLLKIGGASSGKRISSKPENPLSPISQSTVPTVVVHESDERFEDRFVSREFVGEEIPKGRDVTIGLPDLPGYTADSTILRPGFNSHALLARTINLTLNGVQLPGISDNSQYFHTEEDIITYTSRKWDEEILAGSLLHTQNNSLILSATTTEEDSKFWLNWIEVFYRRQTSLNAGQIPFYLVADGRGFNYNFTEAASGETWDVSDPWNPAKLASSNGSTMNVPIQGDANGFRQFIAFTASSIKSPTVSATKTLVLHDSVCQTGAEDIIVTPAAFLDQANKLANQRRMGGQATGPLSVAVVTAEDIYREFGYGSSDYTAIRNFMAFMLRHTAANNTTKPLYLTLFANGHCDYRNKTTQLPVGVPIYEIWKNSSVKRLDCNSFRSSQLEYIPDDQFFVHLTPGNNKMDLALGRVVVHNADEAETFVTKVIKYETSSDQGDWRARATMICDDRYASDGLKFNDGLDHLQATQDEVVSIPSRIVQKEIYGVAYPNLFTSAGRRKPDMEKAIIEAFNSGSAIISWVGHGNPSVWAHESILSVPSTINKLTNFNRLAFVTTATCDFSRYDNYAAPISGGVQLIIKADGGAIASLGTSRSVTEDGPNGAAPTFYKALFNKPDCNSLEGSAPIGFAYIAANMASSQAVLFYIMGDPTQRIIIPRQYVTIDSINGIPFSESVAPRTIAALSQVTISGHISNACDGSDLDASFNGNAAITLLDAPTHVAVTTTFLEQSPITDRWNTDGPILYHGSSTVTRGKFRSTFIVSKDIKFDSSNAKISMLAYSDNFHSALGVTTNIRVYGIETARVDSDHEGPKLTAYIGSRAFHSGDVVPVNSKIIVDVSDISGLNTSTASIGHSFVAWTDDSTAGTIDLASTYVSKQDDYKTGTSEQQALLPVGTHILKVRAFDALDNPTFTEVEFTARDVQPYALYNTTIKPNPVRNQAVFTFLQPSAPESPVDVTIAIFTVIGQQVRELSAQSISQNSVSIPFDGRDNSGTILTDGTYIYRVVARERLSGVQTTSGGKFLIVRN